MKPGLVSLARLAVAAVDAVVMAAAVVATAADAAMAGKGAAISAAISRALGQWAGADFQERSSRTAAMGSARESPSDDN
jgi:hypothetical protein